MNLSIAFLAASTPRNVAALAGNAYTCQAFQYAERIHAANGCLLEPWQDPVLSTEHPLRQQQ